MPFINVKDCAFNCNAMHLSGEGEGTPSHFFFFDMRHAYDTNEISVSVDLLLYKFVY